MILLNFPSDECESQKKHIAAGVYTQKLARNVNQFQQI